MTTAPQQTFKSESLKIAEMLSQQLEYIGSGAAGRDGSIAIAYGRAAGLAKSLGEDATADMFWNKLEALQPSTSKGDKIIDGMPKIDVLFDAYKADPAAFKRFESNPKGEFSAPGTAFSNAAGAYAFALDYMRRGEAAIENGGEPFRIFEAGSAALGAAGMQWQADMMAEMSAQAASIGKSAKFIDHTQRM